MSSFWRNFHHWLHRKLSKWQLSVQSVIKISSKWQHFRFSGLGVIIVWHYERIQCNSCSVAKPAYFILTGSMRWKITRVKLKFKRSARSKVTWTMSASCARGADSVELLTLETPCSKPRSRGAAPSDVIRQTTSVLIRKSTQCCSGDTPQERISSVCTCLCKLFTTPFGRIFTLCATWCLASVVFKYVEGSHEPGEHRIIQHELMDFSAEVYNYTQHYGSNRTLFMALFRRSLARYEVELHWRWLHGEGVEHRPEWTWQGAFSFTASVFTTIGKSYSDVTTASKHVKSPETLRFV